MSIKETSMAISSCSCSSTSNLATQYAEQLAQKLQDRHRTDTAGTVAPGKSGVPIQGGDAPRNGLGESTGLLVSMTA
jgi:hypothetical protein